MAGRLDPQKNRKEAEIRMKHHGFGKSFTLISNSLRSLNIIILADVSISVLN
jgi:hypothetical protein